MHGNIVPVALETSARDYLDLDDAVEMMVRHKYPGPGVILRDDGEEAFRELCKLVLSGQVHPRGRHQDGTTFPAGADQFHDMAARYFRYAAYTRQLAPEPPSDPPPGAVGWATKYRFVKIEGPGSYKVRDSRGVMHPDCNLLFPKAEVEATMTIEVCHNAGPDGPNPPKAGRGGRAPSIDWGMVEEECSRLMAYNGPFSDDDQGWRCQADMERAICEFITKTFRKRLTESVIRSRVSSFLARLEAGN
jgi:hypothetical protein